MASVLIPVVYIIIVFGGLFVFGQFYKKRTAIKQFEPYFPRHIDRDVYVTLLQRSPPTPDPLLKAALVRRAVADVNRIIRLREDKPALQNLLQKGSIGDDLWNSLLAAEKELEAEIMEVVAEANSFVEGWGQIIFSTASEMIANEKTRAVFDTIPEERIKNEAKYPRKKYFDEQPASPTPPSAKSPSTPVPSTSPKSPNNLAPPPSAGAESTFSSDGEGSPRTPSTPSKSSKKSKKRK
ncbi:translocation protein sec66 [Auriscalpium vulgare]|uniref:Translocation protein sec66 n=1 Tax=Auriscalpium vulgare TaxID=40419 RepID=A0ACB8SE24_9AGAM|nr:translocation protein sec66 [Auriscalpium vulgare]